MKKIIKNTMTEPIEMTCSSCASVFSFTFEDIELEDTMFGLSKFRIVRCPVCKEKNDLSKIIINKSGSEDEKRRVL